MRAMLSIGAVISVAWLAGCESGTTAGLEPDMEQPGIELAVAPSRATVDAGSLLRLTARASGRGPLPSAGEVVWYSSDEAVATVEQGGLIRGRSAGQVTIVASWGAARGTAVVTVAGPGSKKHEEPGTPCAKAIPPGPGCA